jgi:hypothetical protein
MTFYTFTQLYGLYRVLPSSTEMYAFFCMLRVNVMYFQGPNRVPLDRFPSCFIILVYAPFRGVIRFVLQKKRILHIR